MKAALVAGLALTAAFLAPESLQFSVETEGVVSSDWNLTTQFELNTAKLLDMGEAQDVGSGSSLTTEFHFELIDTFREVTGEGAPLAISRSYETLSSEQSREGLEGRKAVPLGDGEVSELTGATVDFAFNPETDEWSAAYAEDSSRDEDWLGGLAPRVDLSGVLPDGKIEVGATWDVPTSFLADVLRPGGVVMVTDAPGSGDLPDGGIVLTLPNSGSIAQFGELEGDVSATLKEIVKDGDERLARIVVSVDVSGELDIADYLEAEAEKRGSGESYAGATLTRDLEGELTILWNLTVHKPYAIEGELSGTSEMDVEWTTTSDGFETELGYQDEAYITYTIEATFGA